MISTLEWNKQLREAVFLSLYSLLFDEELFDPTFESIFEEVDIDELDQAQFTDILTQLIAIFKMQHSTFETKIKEQLPQWDQTFLVVKSLLYSFLLEKFLAENNAKASVGQYIRISQHYVGGESPKLIHAVIGALIKKVEEETNSSSISKAG
jgi:transcription termination factor NusB